MAEYVERNLERLLPVFELLKSTELLSENEMKEFVKRCRQHEYRLCKRVGVYFEFYVLLGKETDRFLQVLRLFNRFSTAYRNPTRGDATLGA